MKKFGQNYTLILVSIHYFEALIFINVGDLNLSNSNCKNIIFALLLCLMVYLEVRT
jgi:hypothetical protein